MSIKGCAKVKTQIRNWIYENEDNIITWRRDFHSHPELSWQEFRTQEKILEVLHSFGIDGKKFSGTGISFDLGKEGPIIALRADMDALPCQTRR